jgi:hypothetical protein
MHEKLQDCSFAEEKVNLSIPFHGEQSEMSNLRGNSNSGAQARMLLPNENGISNVRNI